MPDRDCLNAGNIMFISTSLRRAVYFMVLSCAVLRGDIRLQDFTELPVSADLTDATAMAFAPDGRLFVCE